ncbi:hypothetical protein GLOIN_2v1509750 [Rhizophagus irregularis DAOM 181602=DAOM 197198]|uniref:Uncharacterized protein n=1 Tax=Rhizophagus irregularis (strain DAOM 181602 / DAOM 197198 / MUCL 43194) TaxID=747089 RepID=U9UE65_RHIID|nr:hypothetical protein GLOIN_2v1509750 [Rhizophagus irregularis DAOM 181602=DAOM 197198]POG81318.1 hypothetical protein GLOIN_2v1509750 [Rhizophagus irregularis DAOM 181602=DAOM 197198]|eukprot:XP_025188184.1 hypothetical protein GLOIN_2v1509750 [Rhizophagus irregularis DAOM 181602=DAOM 197198]
MLLSRRILNLSLFLYIAINILTFFKCDISACFFRDISFRKFPNFYLFVFLYIS